MQYWTKENPCSYCGAQSNVGHITGCPNYGIYSNDGRQIPAKERLHQSLSILDEIQIGSQVRKIRGYAFDSVVVARFLTRAGETRLVCESTMIPGMLHIFNPDQMELAL